MSLHHVVGVADPGRCADSVRRKGWGRVVGVGRCVSAVSWGVIALVFLAATASALLLGGLELGLLGEAESVRIAACQEKVGGRGGPYVECTGDLDRKSDSDGSRVTVRFTDKPGRTADVVQAPWGSWIPIVDGFVAWATDLLFSALPLAVAGVCGWLAVRAARRPGRVEEVGPSVGRAPSAKAEHR